jgi:hypothetical protein
VTPFPSPNNNGTGRLNDEILYEVANRGIYDIGLIGYSHGGGMIYNISTLLTNEQAGSLGLARVVFVGTIDAVEYGTGADSVAFRDGYDDFSPLSNSPAAGWGCVGVNYWEPNGWHNSGTVDAIRGTNIPGMTNYEIEYLDHGSIAVNSGVLSGIENSTDDVFFSLSF